MPKRKWFRFSLKTLLLLMTVVGVWVGLEIKRVREMRIAVKRIEELGGYVRYGDERIVFDGQTIKHEDPPAPEWLRNLIGDDYFRTVTEVELEFPIPISNYSECPITEEDFAVISRLRKLKSLSIYSELEVLPFDPLNSGHLIHLENLRNLKKLQIVRIPISDEAMIHIGRLSNLRLLNLGWSGITDEGAKHLTNLRNLDKLNLNHTSVSENGLDLETATNLKRLSLSSTRITDKIVPQILRLKQLTQILVHKSQVSEQGVETLRNAFPNAEIIGDK